ncbi:MAG TPA: ring-cleaving dioxygenase [Spirochaetia bacterium]|nr:ring-cleaving dioxygenase [Spirochaetia bacterium]
MEQKVNSAGKLVRGIHHVSVMASDAQENANFYAGVLGMRMVKRTVNQDDPQTYHLFYADAAGTAGSDLTFFIWPHIGSARSGAGQSVEVGLAVPQGSLDSWKKRIEQAGTEVGAPTLRFGERVLTFKDPHGLAIALVETTPQPIYLPWNESPVPEAEQIRGLYGVRLLESRFSGTTEFLTEVMGFEEVGSEDEWTRFAVAGGGSGRVLDMKVTTSQPDGRLGRGSIHHVAWNVGDDEEQHTFRAAIESSGVSPTPVIDRFWFKSVYFHEPGGALFEAATDGPGFLIDEAEESLGTRLILPPRFEQYREQIENVLPPFELPTPARR